MKRIITATVAILLVAGAIPALLAGQTSWSGSADTDVEDCSGYHILEPWEGILYTQGNQGAFRGYWNNDEENDFDADNVDQMGSTDYWKVEDGVWDSDGESFNLSGTWDGYFRINNGDAWGNWTSGGACSGDWWGDKD